MQKVDWEKVDAACRAKPERSHYWFWYRHAIKAARMATTHEGRVNALRSADRFRRYIIGGITRNDYDYAPVMASGHPAWPLRRQAFSIANAPYEGL